MLDSISIFRIFKTGLTNFVRNSWLSATATMVQTVALVIFAVLFLIFGVTKYSLTTFQNNIDISVYFKLGLADSQAEKIQTSIALDPRVKSAEYLNAEQVKENFKERNKDKQGILLSLNELEDNPFPPTMHVKAKDLNFYPDIVSRLQGDEFKDFITSVNYKNDPKIQTTINNLGKILHFIVTFGIGLIIFFSLIAILVLFNTITLTIYNRREEVEIMRLVGATNWYIRGPFLVESLTYAVLASIISAFLIYGIFQTVLPKIAHFVNPELTVFSQNIFNFWFVLLGIFVISILLSVISTLMAIRKYLRV